MTTLERINNRITEVLLEIERFECTFRGGELIQELNNELTQLLIDRTNAVMLQQLPTTLEDTAQLSKDWHWLSYSKSQECNDIMTFLLLHDITPSKTDDLIKEIFTAGYNAKS